MGKILDKFMEDHELDDALVLAMIGDAYLQIIDPEFVYNNDKNKIVPEDIMEEAKRILPEAVALSLMAYITKDSEV